MTDNYNTLMRLSELDTILAYATNIDEIVDIRNKAKVLKDYARGIGESKEITNQIAAARLKAERKAGEILAGMDLVGNNQYSRLLPDGTPSPTLDEIGISRRQSSDWQSIASLPEEKFDSLLLGCLQSGDEITTVFFVRTAHTHLSRTNGNDNETIAEQHKLFEAFSAGFGLGMVSVQFTDVQEAYQYWLDKKNGKDINHVRSQ